MIHSESSGVIGALRGQVPGFMTWETALWEIYKRLCGKLFAAKFHRHFQALIHVLFRLEVDLEHLGLSTLWNFPTVWYKRFDLILIVFGRYAFQDPYNQWRFYIHRDTWDTVLRILGNFVRCTLWLNNKFLFQGRCFKFSYFTWGLRAKFIDEVLKSTRWGKVCRTVL